MSGRKRKKATPPTTVTTNADEVLAAVRRERESRRAADGTVPAASLDMSGLRVVQEMGSEEVGEAIEELFVAAAESIARKESYSFAVPSRSASNQAYVPELDRVVLKANSSKRSLANVGQARKTAIMTRVLSLVHEVVGKGIHVTKRDLFYTDVKLFKKQDESDAVLDDAACTIGCPRSCLNVVAADKGLVVGRLSFLEDGDPIDCTRMGVTGKAIPSYIDKITDVRSDAEFILLVEKDAAYNRLAEDRFYNQFPCILLTGKGQPDVATRMFLRRIAAQLRLPVLAFVDSDPYGLKILSVYMSGSKAMSYDSNSLTTPNIKWLGLRPSDLDAYDLPDQCRLPMTPKDIEMGNHLLKEDFVRKNPKWVAELETMQRTKQKAEIQALSAFGFQFVTQVYLPTKLKQGDWIYRRQTRVASELVTTRGWRQSFLGSDLITADLATRHGLRASDVEVVAAAVASLLRRRHGSPGSVALTTAVGMCRNLVDRHPVVSFGAAVAACGALGIELPWSSAREDLARRLSRRTFRVGAQPRREDVETYVVRVEDLVEVLKSAWRSERNRLEKALVASSGEYDDDDDDDEECDKNQSEDDPPPERPPEEPEEEVVVVSGVTEFRGEDQRASWLLEAWAQSGWPAEGTPEVAARYEHLSGGIKRRCDDLSRVLAEGGGRFEEEEEEDWCDDWEWQWGGNAARTPTPRHLGERPQYDDDDDDPKEKKISPPPLEEEKTVDVTHYSLSNSGAAKLAALLPAGVRTARFADCHLSDAALARLVESLPTTVARLDVSRNRAGPLAAAALETWLGKMSRQALDVSYCGLGALTVVVFERARLEEDLNLAGNRLDAPPVLPSVQTVNLEWNTLSSPPALPLTLRTCNLACNALLKDGGLTVAKALATHPAIAFLNLSRNRIRGKRVAKALAKAALTAPNLKRLVLDYNLFGTAGCEAIRSILADSSCPYVSYSTCNVL